jgi:PAS domain S-box-containing protein
VLASSEFAEPPEVSPLYPPNEGDIGVEVRNGGRLLGRLVIAGAASPMPPEQLEAFSAAAGSIMAQAEQWRQASSLMEESRVLRDLALKLGEHERLEQLYTSIVRSARRLLDADYASITHLAPDGSTRWLATDGYRSEAYHTLYVPAGKGMAARVVASGKPLILEGIGISPDLPAEEFPIHAAEGGVAALAVPLMSRGAPTGALTVSSRRPRRWKPTEIELAMVFANSASIVSEQMRISAEERAHSAFLERLLENIPGVLLVLEPPDFRVVRANSRFNEIIPGPPRTREEIIGVPILQLAAANAAPDRVEPVLSALQSVVATGQPVSFPRFEYTQRGDKTYWDWSAILLDEVGASGERLLMLIAHDITELVLARQQTQQAADDARARADELEAVINHMVDGVVIFDRSGRIVRMNPMGQRLVGRELPRDAHPRDYPNLYSLYTPNGKPLTREQLASTRALTGETVVGMQMMVRRPDGREVIISSSGAPLRDASGEISGAVVVFHDITQEKLIDRMKDEFLSIVSHELRTPLTAIMGYGDLLLRGVHGSLTDRQAKSLNAVRANANRLLHLINDLLDVSKLESGTVRLDLQPTDLADVVTRTIAQTRVLAADAGVSLANNISKAPMPYVLADEPKLQQVLENLLTNAVKFTPNGGTITFTAGLSPLPADHPDLTALEPVAEQRGPDGAQSVVVSVTDNGAGLEEDQLERIWDRFYQVDSTSRRRTGGAGLGLAIVQNLVDLHGGRVWARSDGKNQGSTFSFSLPLATHGAVLPKEPEPTPRKHPPQWTADAQTQGQVLVVEDDPDQREIICEMLEMEGFRVLLAEDGEEAVSLALSTRPAAIILDVILPRADGWEVLHRLKDAEATADIPVLILSVVDQPGFGKRLGADEYLIKPLEPNALRKTIRRLVRAASGQNGAT